MAPAESEEPGLQLAAGVVRVELGIDRKTQVFRPAQRLLELRLGKEAAQVGERSGWGRDWDAGSPGYFAGEEGQRPMDSYSTSRPSIARNGHMREPPLGEQLPERSRAGVAQNGLGSTGKHRRQASPFLAQPDVPDRVNTAMNAVQAAGSFPRGSALAANSEFFELRERDNAVLVRRQPGDRGVRSAVGEFCMHGYA